MNINRMHVEFKLSYDKLDSSAYPEILTPSIDAILNEAYERVIKTRYNPNNIYKKGFEQSQKRTDDLKQLVKTKFAVATAVTTETNTYRVNLQAMFDDEALTTPSTSQYMFYLRSRPRHVSTTCGSRYALVNIYETDDLDNDALINPFKKSYLLESVGYFEDGDIMIVTDGTYSIDKVKVTFIKIPLRIDKAQILLPLGLPGTSSIELDEHMQREIIQHAVNIALESVESIRQQTQRQQLNTIE